MGNSAAFVSLSVVHKISTIRYFSSGLSTSSIILKDKSHYVQQLEEGLPEDFKWRLCYRASRDGRRGRDFRKHCDNKGPTVTLVQVEDCIFGGYNDKNWDGMDDL